MFINAIHLISAFKVLKSIKTTGREGGAPCLTPNENGAGGKRKKGKFKGIKSLNSPWEVTTSPPPNPPILLRRVYDHIKVTEKK